MFNLFNPAARTRKTQLTTCGHLEDRTLKTAIVAQFEAGMSKEEMIKLSEMSTNAKEDVLEFPGIEDIAKDTSNEFLMTGKGIMAEAGTGSI